MSWISPELIEILLTILKAVVILLVVVTCGAFMSFGERRLLGLFQNRYGPNRVGWGGSLQLVADMIKMFFKEDWIPKFSDRVIFTLAPMIAFTSLLLAFAIVPVSPGWVVADLNIGILFFLMMAGLAVYAVLFAGWSSNNKYSLLGAMRASAQTLSYEVFLGLSLMGVVAQAAGVASFPFLAALAARGDDAGFDKTLGTALRGSMLVVIPLTAYMLAVALPTLGFIFEGGRFSAEETILAAPLLQILLLSVPFWVVQQVIGRAFYARQNTLTPAIVGTVATLAALPVYPLAVKLWGAFGVAMLTTLCLFVYTLALSWFWIRKHGTGAFDGMGHQLLKGGLLVLPGTLLAFFAVYGLPGRLPLWFPSLYAYLPAAMRHAAICGIAGVIFAVPYLLLAKLFMPEALSLKRRR